MTFVVAVTDNDWANFLRRRPALEEINFWSPSGGQGFRALRPGELFLFKLHAPENLIVGGGVFTYATQCPCSLAWSAFGEGNGVGSEHELREKIARHRRVWDRPLPDFVIGCRILTNPFFFDETSALPPPRDWARNIVTFKTYETDSAEGRRLWDEVAARVQAAKIPREEPLPRYGEPVLVRPRLGQGTFRLVVADLYERRCAVTRERTLPALEAAHIRPYAQGGSHEPRNGILLRRDIHALYDSGYVTITPDFRFEVSRRIREEYENGRAYYALNGQPVAPPTKRDEAPDPETLRWHRDNVFLG